MRDDDLHIVEEDSKEDSQTPTDKGSVMDEDECPPSNSKLAHEVSSLQKQCTVLSHQMNVLMMSLRLPRCVCPTCEAVMRKQHAENPIRLPMNGQPVIAHRPAPPTAPTHASQAPQAAPVPQQQPAPAPQVFPTGTPVAIPIANGIRILNPSSIPRASVVVTPKEDHKMEATPSENGSTSTEGEIKEVTVIRAPQNVQQEAAAAQLVQQFLSPAVLQTITNGTPSTGGANPFEQQNHGGRKSKYCTPEAKKVVAEYASVHGAAQAARQFGIPPSVAAYYQRKLAKIKQNEAQATQIMASAFGVPPLHLKSDSMPSVSDSYDSPTKNLDGTPTTPTTPSFLRGRGRGRPKLIGDELDAELIEYMVKLKKAQPNIHLVPATALDIAKAYIQEHAPAILIENGGSVTLKLTWAMKLVSRIQEREHEIKLGLPAGTLNNYGRSGLMQLQSLTDGNMINGLTQSFLSQIASQLGDHISNESLDTLTTPQLIEGKELTLADFASFGGMEMGEEDKEEDKDGSTTPEVTDETQELSETMEGIQSCHSSLAAC